MFDRLTIILKNVFNTHSTAGVFVCFFVCFVCLFFSVCIAWYSFLLLFFVVVVVVFK